eukprot:GEMP01026253.1.p1 GENE.GEMP01026253.1~~GEMP01026253.1.p1  ORF type:complete len:461 (+),score=123.10 GEMP01026253.1:90-1472(+)
MLRLALFTAAFAALKKLSDADFDAFIKDNDRVLVKFYAPWCGHCKSMAAGYESAAKILEGKVALAEVDATEEKVAAGKYDVQGFPSLKYFYKGEVSDYDGGREEKDFIDWADDITSPAVSTETPPAPTTRPIIMLYANELNKDFESVAEKNRKAGKFYHVVSDANKITHQHPHEEINELTTLDEASITTFITNNKLPLVGVLDGKTFQEYTTSGTGLIWSLFPMEAAGELEKVARENMPLMKSIANATRGKYAVTYTDTTEFAQAIEGMLGVTEFPAIVIQKKAGDKQKFVYDGPIEAEKVIQYIADIDSGKIVAKLKSEPIPEEQGDVKVVVGDNLKEIVFSPTKDVLFEVYAPWCGHCKKLEPEYEKLAAKVVKDIDEYVTIAKMDGTANDSPVESIEWSGFPTMVFIKAGSEEVLPYNGDRNAEGMWKYIKENGSHKDKILVALNTKYESAEQHDEL